MEVAAWAVRFALVSGALLAAGHVLSLLIFGHTASRIVPAIIAAAAACGGFMLQAAALTGALSGAVDPAMLGLLWSTAQGTALAVHLAGAGLIVLGAALAARALQGAGAVVLLSGFAVVGHVADVPGLWLSAGLLVHLVLAAFWIGVLWPLFALAGTQPDAAARMGARFGTLALWAVPVLIAVGVLMAVVLLDTVQQLWTTDYGRSLLVKIGAVSAMLALGAANKLRHVPALQQGTAGAGQGLRRSLAAEGCAAALVLAATAMFSTLAGLP